MEIKKKSDVQLVQFVNTLKQNTKIQKKSTTMSKFGSQK